MLIFAMSQLGETVELWRVMGNYNKFTAGFWYRFIAILASSSPLLSLCYSTNESPITPYVNSRNHNRNIHHPLCKQTKAQMKHAARVYIRMLHCLSGSIDWCFKQQENGKVNIEFIITPKIELVLKASIDILICDINSNVMLSVIGNFEPSKNGKVKPAVLIQK